MGLKDYSAERQFRVNEILREGANDITNKLVLEADETKAWSPLFDRYPSFVDLYERKVIALQGSEKAELDNGVSIMRIEYLPISLMHEGDNLVSVDEALEAASKMFEEPNQCLKVIKTAPNGDAVASFVLDYQSGASGSKVEARMRDGQEITTPTANELRSIFA